MLHWEEGEDKHGFRTWLRFIDCGPWGLVLTNELPRWIIPHSWECGIAQIKPLA